MEEKEKEEKEVEEKKIDKKKNNNHNKYAVEIVCLIVFLILLGVCAGWYGNKLFSKSDKNVKEEKTSTTNCLDFYSEPVQEENKEEKPAKVESEWRSIGTDISKVKANYDLLQSFTYRSSRARGGLSFFDEELLTIALIQINENDLTDIEKEDDSYVYYAKLSRDKVDSILKKTFGTNFNYDYSLNKNKGIDYKKRGTYRELGQGNEYTALTYEEESRNFIVFYRGGYDGTSGPSPKITTRKVSEVFEKDDMVKVIERVIYLDSISYSNNIEYHIYAEPSKTFFLGSKTFKEEEINNKEINVDEYKDAGVITSIFKKDENSNYIFVSSELSNKPL